MAKTVAQRRAAARKVPENIATHKWRLLIAVNDGLRLELVRIYEAERGKMFEYRYPEPKNQQGLPSTKFDTSLTMPETQLESEIEKVIFKVIADEIQNRETPGEASATGDLEGNKAENRGYTASTNTNTGTVQSLF